jgi:hypothetical protein
VTVGLHLRIPLDTMIALGVLALGSIGWLPYAVRAGFLYDDWTFVAASKFHTVTVPLYRPFGAILGVVDYWLGGDRPLIWYLSVVILFAGFAALLYAALRTLHLWRGAALASSLLLLVFPYADSQRLWWADCLLSASFCVALISVIIGRRWILRRTRAWVWFSLSLTLVAISVLFYEAAAAIVLLPITLIFLSPSWTRRRTLLKLAADLVVVLIVWLFDFRAALSSGLRTARPLSSYPGRIVALIHEGYDLFVHRMLGAVTWWEVLLGVATGTSVLGLLLARNGRVSHARDSEPRSGAPLAWWTLPATLCLLAAGAVAAWMPYAPAGDYYSPLLLGVGNRVNGAAAPFIVIALALIAALPLGCVRLPRAAWLGLVGLTTAITVALAASFVDSSYLSAREWANATATRDVIYAELQAVSPHVRPGDVVALGDYNAYFGADWVPVVAASWDANAIAQVAVGTSSVTGIMLLPTDQCAPTGLVDPGTGGAGSGLPGAGRLPSGMTIIDYGRIYTIDVDRNRDVVFTSRAQCLTLLPELSVRLFPAP